MPEWDASTKERHRSLARRPGNTRLPLQRSWFPRGWPPRICLCQRDAGGSPPSLLTPMRPPSAEYIAPIPYHVPKTGHSIYYGVAKPSQRGNDPPSTPCRYHAGLRQSPTLPGNPSKRAIPSSEPREGTRSRGNHRLVAPRLAPDSEEAPSLLETDAGKRGAGGKGGPLSGPGWMAGGSETGGAPIGFVSELSCFGDFVCLVSCGLWVSLSAREG